MNFLVEEVGLGERSKGGDCVGGWRLDVSRSTGRGIFQLKIVRELSGHIAFYPGVTIYYVVKFIPKLLKYS